MLAKDKIIEIFLYCRRFLQRILLRNQKNINFQLPMPKRIEIIPVQCWKVK